MCNVTRFRHTYKLCTPPSEELTRDELWYSNMVRLLAGTKRRTNIPQGQTSIQTKVFPCDLSKQTQNWVSWFLRSSVCREYSQLMNLIQIIGKRREQGQPRLYQPDWDSWPAVSEDWMSSQKLEWLCPFTKAQWNRSEQRSDRPETLSKTKSEWKISIILFHLKDGMD